MAAITRILALTPFALLTLGGCGGDSAKWVGTWEGERKGLVDPSLTDNVANGLRRIEIKIGQDGRYEMVEAGIPTKGQVHFGKERALLTVMSRMDRELTVPHQDLILEFQEDGSILYRDPNNDFPQPARLTRVSATSPAVQP